jgi:hypothetical protein
MTNQSAKTSEDLGFNNMPRPEVEAREIHDHRHLGRGMVENADDGRRRDRHLDRHLYRFCSRLLVFVKSFSQR